MVYASCWLNRSGLVFVAALCLGAAVRPSKAAEPCAAGHNCLLNPSFDEPSPAPGRLNHWSKDVFGKSDAVFGTTSGRTGTTAATVTVKTFSGSQDAKWLSDDVAVSEGQYYVLENWYKSATATELDIFFQGDKPSIKSVSVPPSESSTTWTRAFVEFTVPNGAKSIAIGHALIGAGTLVTDDYSLVLRLPPLFTQGLVSLTFDDGWKSVFTNAIPVLDEAVSPTHPAGLKSTHYIITDATVVHPEHFQRNMSVADLVAMDKNGHEIAAHSRTHPDLAKLDRARQDDEIKGSLADLAGAGFRVTSFAYPYGSFDTDVEREVAAAYRGARSVQRGYNFTDTDRFALRTMSVRRTTSADQIVQWIDYAVANRVWLIVTFHRIEKTIEDCVQPRSDKYDEDCTDVATLKAVADHLKAQPAGTTRTVSAVLRDLAAGAGVASVEAASQLPLPDVIVDPPSALAGQQMSTEAVLAVSYAAGFRGEDQLLAAVAMAVSESQLWTGARNWHPELGFRPVSDVIGTEGPPEAWNADHRQMHSDRGIWQISSYWWGRYPDSATDTPDSAAAAFFELSKNGTDFSRWDSYSSGRAQAHYDAAFDGWPALRPLVHTFLAAHSPQADATR